MSAIKWIALLAIVCVCLTAMVLGLNYIDTGTPCIKDAPFFLAGTKIDCEAP